MSLNDVCVCTVGMVVTVGYYLSVSLMLLGTRIRGVLPTQSYAPRRSASYRWIRAET
jgi:hypothetical protein